MDRSEHSLNALFAQLGLPCSDQDIQAFVSQHRPLNKQIPLSQAPFWAPNQAAFLDESLAEDSDWAEVVDQLNVMLR